MLKKQIAQLIDQAVQKAISEGQLNLKNPPSAKVELPRNPEHGDYATNMAMVLTKEAKMPPLGVAEIIIQNVPQNDLVAAWEIAKPGFINIRLRPEALQNTLTRILSEKERFGRSTVGESEKILLEYVSANPTGPLHVGHGRWAAIGSVLANLLKATGHAVDQEFYINDAGTQMQLLARSVYVRYLDLQGKPAEFPENGYRGDYIRELAQEIMDQRGSNLTPEQVAEEAYTNIFAKQKALLESFGVRFDRWFSERTLHDSGEVKKTLEELKKRGDIEEKDGATWFLSSKFGDDKDRVLIKENGELTYLSADIAYHWDKYKRGYNKVINIWGADHHGYIGRMKAAVQALGYPSDSLVVIIGQLVNLFRGGEPVRMSKRTGEMVTLEEVMEEVGPDAVRYWMVFRSPNTPLDFDLEVAKAESMDNPIYYIQYAHARICGIERVAAERGVDVEKAIAAADLSKLIAAEERKLLYTLAQLPDVLAEAAQALEVHRLPSFAREVAEAFHSFYTEHRVLGVEDEITAARLALVRSSRIVLKNILDIVGVHAPERM